MKKCDFEDDQTKCSQFPEWAKGKKCPRYRLDILGCDEPVCNGPPPEDKKKGMKISHY